jgi:hypothetical protein
VKGQLPLSVEGLRSQGVEQFGRSEALISLLDYQLSFLGIHVKRDKLPPIAYSEELISFAMSATLQSTDRRHGIVGQECCHFQRDS